jgi:nucleoside-diphosphate-sugar epimerase
MVKKILLTGVTGFLGSHLARVILSSGYDLVALKRGSSSLRRIESIQDNIALIDVDNINFEALFTQHGNIDAIIHTATTYGRTNETINEIFTANTTFPLKLLEAASRAGVKLFLNTDTILDKNLNPYALSKYQLTQWGKFFSIHNNIKFINLRLEHFYGPKDVATKFTTYVINNCMDNISELKLTFGEQKRDFIYIDDVVSAYLIVLKNATDFNKSFVEFDIGSGKSISIRSFVETVHRLTGSNTHLAFGVIPYRIGEAMDSSADISNLSALGWKCQYDLVEGLKRTINQER